MKTKNKTKKTNKSVSLKTNEELLKNLRESGASPETGIRNRNLLNEAANRIDALIAALVKLEIKFANRA